MNLPKYLLLAWAVLLAALPVRADEEQSLIDILQSSAGPVAKAEACKKLRVVGTAKSVPALAAVLGEDRISQAARYALEGMPFPEAGAALREALGKHSGLAKVGLIDSVGWRHDNAAVPLLVPLLLDSDASLASAAASSLGRIAGREAAAALTSTRDKAAPAVRPVVIEALLKCAERLQGDNEPRGAEAIYNALLDAREEEQTRVAAAAGLMRAANDGGLAQIKAALEGNDSAAIIAALQVAGGRDRKHDRGQRAPLSQIGLTEAVIGILPKARPELQVALVGLLQENGDVSAAPAVVAAAGSANAAVRAAAVSALGKLGDATAVPLLLEAANSTEPSVQAAARKSLEELRRGDVAAALIGQLTTATPGGQLEVVRALSARSDKTAVPELLRLARSDRLETRKAAFAALGNLAEGGDVPGLVELLAETKNADTRAAMRVVFESLAERTGEKPGWSTAPITNGLRGSDPELRTALLPIASLFIDEPVRSAVRSCMQDPDARLRAAAARALCDTRDAALVPDLLALARQTTDESLKSLAIERVVRLTTAETTAAPVAQRAETLAAAMDLASRPEDRRMVLSGLAQVPHRVTLELAGKACADPEVKAEAEVACLQIAQKLSSSDFALAEASLKKLASGSGNATVQANARAALNKLNSGWLCAGPYRETGKTARQLFNIAFAPEKPGATGVQWQRAPGSADPAHPGAVDLASIVQGNNCVVYLKTRVYVPEAQPVQFSIGSDDGIKLWVNGDLVHANNAVRGLTPDQDKAKGQLRAGWNDLVAKITQSTMGCGMTLRITKGDGNPVAGLQMDPNGAGQPL